MFRLIRRGKAGLILYTLSRIRPFLNWSHSASVCDFGIS
ncbi:hypothetical protein LEP1GSC108_4075 [Leptospira weilii str. UI 13098]|uniref:Uncharacterized protein n=1 Tax=Leptospira weilii str. UI 13098 TaxID=1088542 RepID=M6Q8D4_9LEPT|nr:hypothetical protein LEP1GSC108_4075 [Leptospira weilii str. UI 13098]